MKFTFKHLLLGTAALGACASSSALMAQDTAVDNGTTEVVVTKRRPLAESQAAALQVQKSSDSLVSVLSADAIGDLPDQNIAQAVSRLPGVGVERDQGQGRYINLRGAPRYWTTLSFDGLSVVSPEGRQTRFDNIPSAIASQVTVQKALVPSMPGDTVAGNVDIRTRRAFDYKGQKITGKLGIGHVELGEGQEIDSSLVYSNIYLGGKLGIVAQASYYTREMATENWETDPYLYNATAPSKRFAQETKNKHYRLVRENTSYSLRADYKLNANHTLFASSIYTNFHDDELRDQFIFQLNQGTGAAKESYTSSGFINGNDPITGTVYGGRISSRITYRDNYDIMTTSTVGGEHFFENGLAASWRLNYTDTENTGDNPLEIRFQPGGGGVSVAFTDRPTFVYNFRNPTSNFATLYRTTGTDTARTRGSQVQNVEDFAHSLSQISVGEATEITEATTFKVDFDYNMPVFGKSSKVEFGGLITNREKENNTSTWQASSSQLAANTGVRYGDVAQNGAYLGEQYLSYTFRYSDEAKAYDLLNRVRAGAATSANNGDFYNVQEDVSAAYIMATTDMSFGNLVYGVRVEQIENTGKAYASINGVTSLIETNSEETLYYPSAHLNWNLSPRLKARFGVTTSASRADFDDLRPNLTINDTLDTISGGNPFAKPDKQSGLDAYLEYYGPKESFFSIGVYSKDISDVLFNQTVTLGNNSLDSNGVDRSSYAFSSVVNGGDGYLRGLEVFYSGTIEGFAKANNFPAWVEGFGLRASATFTESEVNIPASSSTPARKTTLSGTSDGVYNLQAIYEKYGLTVRLAYQYRTPWLQDIGGYRTAGGLNVPDGNGDIYWAADEEVDLSMRYQLNKRVEIFFDGVNLTNDGSARYADTAAYPIEYERFGKRMIAGVRFNF
jgi:TonB-dependent receptor